MTYTHTVAVLEVSQETFDEIKGKLLAAGYAHAVDVMDGWGETVDMHGIALAIETRPALDHEFLGNDQSDECAHQPSEEGNATAVPCGLPRARHSSKREV